MTTLRVPAYSVPDHRYKEIQAHFDDGNEVYVGGNIEGKPAIMLRDKNKRIHTINGIPIVPIGKDDLMKREPLNRFEQQLQKIVKETGKFPDIVFDRDADGKAVGAFGITNDKLDKTPKIAESNCLVCNEPASKKCSRCKRGFYCGKEHQQLDWKRHKLQCNTFVSIDNSHLSNNRT